MADENLGDAQGDHVIEGDAGPAADAKVEESPAPSLLVESIYQKTPGEVLDLYEEPEPGKVGVRFWSRPTLLEAVKKDGAVEKIRGQVPLLIVGKKTQNDVVYTVECARRLVRDLKAVLESKADEWIGEGPWPVGAMYLSHGDRLDMVGSFPNLSAIAARITDVFVLGGKDLASISDGDMIGIGFESLSTQRGRDLVALVTESNFIKGISHAAFTVEGMTVVRDGVEYVDAIRVEAGFGADFCDRPANAYDRPSAAALRLEQKVKRGGEDEEKKMPFDMEKLRTEQPEVAAMIDAANWKVRAKDVEAVSGVIVESFRAKAREADSSLLPATAVDGLVESVKVRVHEVASKIAEQRPNLDVSTVEFKDAVVSVVSPHFEAEMKRMQAFAAESAAAALKAAGVAVGTPKADPGKSPEPKFAALINTLPYEALLVESDNERVGLPRGRKNADGSFVAARLTDVVLSRAMGDRPVYVETPYGPMHVLDVHHPGLRTKVAQLSDVYMKEAFYTDPSGRGQTDRAILNDARFHQISQKMARGLKLEADEMLTSDVLGTLHPSIRQGVLEYLFATAVFLQIAGTVPCSSDTYKIAYRDYKRKANHKFGSKAQGSAFSTSGDEGALTIADPYLYAKVTTITSGEVVLTVEYTNENGTTGRTTTVTIPTATAVGEYVRIYPAAAGEKFLDVTGCTDDSGWASGAVDLVCFEPVTGGAELTNSGKAGSTIEYASGTVQEMDLRADISWRTIEDANISLANVGPGRVDIAAMVLRDMGNDMADFIDRRGFDLLNDPTDFLSANTVSHDVTSVPAGYTLKEWKAELLDKFYQLKGLLLARGHIAPNFLVLNTGDEHKYTWIGEKFSGQPSSRVEMFLNGMGDWPKVAGAQVYVSSNQNWHRGLMGSRDTVFFASYIPLQIRGPLWDGSTGKADTYIMRSRSAQVTVRPETRGYVEITE